jgi:hypothetical protein
MTEEQQDSATTNFVTVQVVFRGHPQAFVYRMEPDMRQLLIQQFSSWKPDGSALINHGQYAATTMDGEARQIVLRFEDLLFVG